MPAKQHDNQHTTPAFSEADWIRRFNELLPTVHGGEDQHDWAKLFVQFIRGDQSAVGSLRSFLKPHGINMGSVSTRGGAMFWNRARKAVQGRALAIALERAPEKLASKYEKQLRIVSKLEDAIEHRIDAIRKLQCDPQAIENPFEVAMIEKLIDGIDTLTKTNVLLNNDGVQKHEIKSLNLHASLVEAIKNRDDQFGVK